MKHRIALRAFLVLVLACLVGWIGFSRARTVHLADLMQPAPAYSDPVPTRHVQTATFAAGCFWSMQAIFQQIKGVERAAPGYAGGTVANPTYDQVETGSTGHAETVNITFDPDIVSYRELLHVLLTVRDPTTINRQGPDEGTNYRSVIFYRTAEQEKEARQEIQSVSAEHVWPDPLVIAVEPFKNFYPAESYHWDYYRLHPDEPYCQTVIAPEIQKFRDLYPKLLQR
jgi:peptide-methionine (S)-S-oxide reductase